jgi:hypothetical protein
MVLLVFLVKEVLEVEVPVLRVVLRLEETVHLIL